MPVEDTRDADEIELSSRRAEAHHRAVVLEMVGDLPDAGECQLRETTYRHQEDNGTLQKK